MKLQKKLAVLATVSLMAVSVGCQKSYDKGFTAGQTQGYQEGYADGDADGFERAKLYFASADYNSGFADGKVQGISIGYNQGYGVGKQDGLAQGYTSGYNVGYNDGYDDGFDDGEGFGYTIGYGDGYDDGAFDGYELGYDDGFADGYDVGYGDGFDDGYGLSVGQTKNLKGYANVLSTFHNDLIDYSKIKAPLQTKRGLIANGKLLLSETSVTNKDTLKKAAVVEQYLVIEMAKQVKGKFGLSAERSLKIAKASNHFRKYASKRALSSEDTNAYASEILGSDFDSIAQAYEAGKKGDFNAFNTVMEKAAQKNETSPEKMSEIVAKMFI